MKEKHETSMYTFRMPKDAKIWLKEIARVKEKTVSCVLRLAINAYIDEWRQLKTKDAYYTPERIEEIKNGNGTKERATGNGK